MINQLQAITTLALLVIDNTMEDVLSSRQDVALHLAPMGLGEYMEGTPSGFQIISGDAPFKGEGDVTVESYKAEDGEIESFSEVDYHAETAWKLPKGSEVGVAFFPGQKQYLDFQDTHRFDKWALETMLYTPNTKEVRERRCAALKDALETCEARQELDSIMLCVNYFYQIGVAKGIDEGDWSAHGLKKEHMQQVREVYLDKVYNFATPNNTWFCSTGDNPVTLDTTTDWSMNHESAGGFNRLDPKDDEDFQQRNGLECHSEIINQSEITNKQRGGEFTKELGESRKVRIARYERLKLHLMEMTDPKLRTAHLNKIEAKWSASLKQCAKESNWINLLITTDQMNNLRELVRQLNEVDVPAPF